MINQGNFINSLKREAMTMKNCEHRKSLRNILHKKMIANYFAINVPESLANKPIQLYSGEKAHYSSEGISSLNVNKYQIRLPVESRRKTQRQLSIYIFLRGLIFPSICIFKCVYAVISKIKMKGEGLWLPYKLFKRITHY